MNDVFQILRISGSALNTQRVRLSTIANNIANVNTTRTEEGGPYQRRRLVVQPREKVFQLPLPQPITVLGEQAQPAAMMGVEAKRIVVDDRPGPRVYEPDHPDADEDGFVEYPNVDLVTEMTDMVSATRSYQANVTVVNSTKQMALKALDIGRG